MLHKQDGEGSGRTRAGCRSADIGGAGRGLVKKGVL
jgi:hypothetical protein